MQDGWDQADLALVVLVGLARESEEDVPEHLNAVVGGPLETLKILQRAHALLHLPKLRHAQALDPRLHGLEAAAGQGLHLALADVALRLDEDLQVVPLGGEFPEEPVNVLHVDDVIHEAEPRRVVAVRERLELLEHLLGSFGPELHALRIQAAECAMVLLAPPAPARRLVKQDLVDALCRLRVELPQQVEVVVIIRRTGPLEVGEQRLVRCEDDLSPASVGHAGPEPVLLSIQHLLCQTRKDVLALPDHHIINPGEGAEMLESHLAVIVRAAKDDRHRGIQVLDELRHREAGDILIEGGREADDRVLTPVNLGQHAGEILRRAVLLELFEERRRAAGLARHVLEDRLECACILVVLGMIAEQQMRKQPFAEEPALLAQHLVQRDTDLIGEVQIEMVGLDPEAVRFEDRRERPQLDRGVLARTERHVDERDFRAVTHALTSPPINEATLQPEIESRKPLSRAACRRVTRTCSCRSAIAAVEDPAPRPCAPPGSHSTSPAPLQLSSHSITHQSRNSERVARSWRHCTHPALAGQDRLVPWSSPAAAFAKRPEMARAAERRNPFQEATGTPVMRQQDQRMKSGIRKSFRIALRRGACAGSSSSRRQTDGRGRSSWRQRRAASAPTRRRSSRRPAVRDIPAMP